MTTHELAHLLDHLQQGFGSGLNAQTKTAFTEASSAFRELPDKPLKQLVKEIKAKPAIGPKGKVAVDLPQFIDRIRTVQRGQASAETVLPELGALNNTQLKEVLRAFDQKGTTGLDANRDRVRGLLRPKANGSHSLPEPKVEPEIDLNLVEQGVQLFTRLQETKGITIPEVRAQFEPIRHYPKAVVEEISRRVGYTPFGSREEVANRMLSNLEGIKMNQLRGESILAGV